jgi:hypothetical protein
MMRPVAIPQSAMNCTAGGANAGSDKGYPDLAEEPRGDTTGGSFEICPSARMGSSFWAAECCCHLARESLVQSMPPATDHR